MKLFLHDEKHDRVNAELDLGEIAETEKVLLEKVIKFSGDNHITSRYNRLIMATSYREFYDEKDDFREIIFTKSDQ